jgi:hypothetical protein
MDDLRNDPEYEIRWPSDTLAAELDRLIARGREDRPSVEWKGAVETLLRQAFSSPVPQREFGEKWDQSAPRFDPVYGEEEPF